jgi:cullin-5
MVKHFYGKILFQLLNIYLLPAVNLCSNSEDKLTIYMDNFERAYIDSTEAFYKLKAPQYLEINGVQNYMRYAESKLREEEQRANKYLESCSIATVLMAFYYLFLNLVIIFLNLSFKLNGCCVNVLVTAFKETILAECSSMIKQDETQSMFTTFNIENLQCRRWSLSNI